MMKKKEWVAGIYKSIAICAALVSAAPAYAQATSSVGGIYQFVFIIGIFALFYFLLIRPQRKRQKEHQQMVDALTQGDEIITASGILGKVSDIDEGYIDIQVASNTTFKMQKTAVHAILPKGTLKSIGVSNAKATGN